MSEMRTELARVSARSAAERRAASLAVAARAENVDDCRELLAMLGLLPAKPRAPKKPRAKRPSEMRITPGTSGWRPS